MERRQPTISSTLATTTTARRRRMNHVFVVVVLIGCLLPLAGGCPAEVCICKWKGGKQTVECGSQQLATIPEGMDPGTQVLNFSGNSLQVLQSERFLRMDLLNLQKIYLSRNQLIRIHEKAFRGLSNLVELDLSDNMLQHVPSETFQDYSSLMRLSLNGNPIRELKTSAFRHLSFLTTLELSNCQIERIENEAFVGMDNLEWLRLDGNRIGFIQGGHILPKSLHGISLQSNRWTCDCRLLDMHAWLVNYNTPQSEEPKCMEPPRLKGQVINNLKKDELACLPEVSPESSYREISEGRNMSIECVVRAIPEPKILWLFNGQVLSNDSLMDNLHMFYYIDESGSIEEKRSEIFIYNVGAEDNGTFSCVGTNIAGSVFSNYTLRVIVKEPPVVNEVSFPRDYMNYIIASSSGAGVIFVILLCTIVVKCKHREPNKRKKVAGGGQSQSAAASSGGSSSGQDGSSNDSGIMKCSSILNDSDNLNGGSGLLMNECLTPSKLAKENGVIIGGQMKQNLLLYAPGTHIQSAGQLESGSLQALQLNMQLANGHSPPPPLMMDPSQSYCSPPASLRNYQEKNPDLVNDAESGVKHKLKSPASLDTTDYDAASDCSGPCSIQGMSTGAPVQYDGCYQLSQQFGSQIIARSGASPAPNRFAGMTTLPRGMQLKQVMSAMGGQLTAMGSGAPPQHQVDVHLNPVCFLGQDGYAYDYSNVHVQAAPAMQQHLHLQTQHSAPMLQSPNDQQQQQMQHQQQQQQPHQQMQQQQQQNFYRTLPHNRAHKRQQFAGVATNPGMRCSLEADFPPRSITPVTYDKYLPNVRFTAEGYPQQPAGQPQHQQQQHFMQYPSPPEGYKSPAPAMAAGMEPPSTISANAFQQWPSCLPGYHAYPQTLIGVLNPPPPQQQQQQQQMTSVMTGTTACSQQQQQAQCQDSESNQPPTTTTSGTSTTTTTIQECDETEVSPSSSATEIPQAGGAGGGKTAGEPCKLRHLNGPLADSPDEGYVGDSHEGSDM